MNYPDQLKRGLSNSAAALLEMSALQGPQYLPAITKWLCQELDTFAVSIGELVGESMDEINVLSFASRIDMPGPDRYSLKGTPCSIVIESRNEHCVVSHALRDYPEDQLFAEHQIDSYVGIPLRDGFNRTFGLVCVFDNRPRDDTEQILSLLNWLAERIGNEAGYLRTRRNLANSVRWMAPSRPEDVFANVTAHLCEVLQVSTAFIAEWSESHPGQQRTLMLLHEGRTRQIDSTQLIPLESTSFADLKGEDFLSVTEDLHNRFPDCPVLGELALSSMLVLCIKDREGRKLGHLGIAHSRLIETALRHSPVLALYLARVTAELERLAAERERAEIERALGVKHKLESLGLMAGHIAHDFNNLLMAILGNANLAADQLPPDSPGHRFIENIEAAATSAGDVVSQLLDYAGRKPNRVSLLDVSQAVAAASRLVALTRAPDTEVSYQLADALPLVEVDPAQLQQIVINLVLNAAEALNGKSGRIGIRVELKRLSARDIARLPLGRELAAGDYVEVSVSDTGQGIDEGTLARMFDPFFTRKPDGRGLGLSAVQGFVKANGGGLAIRTELGAGTEVFLYLPPAQGTITSKPDSLLPNKEATLSVLVVDDELLVAQTASQMLEAQGYETAMALSCEEALALAGKQRFDCALLDVRMPRIDGWTTLRRLREVQAQLPVVMMTGYANEARASDLVARYQVGLIYKPFQKAQLVAALNEVTSSVSSC